MLARRLHAVLLTCLAAWLSPAAWAVSSTVDATGDSGGRSSMQLADGKPVIAYTQDGHIKLATCTADCATAAPTWVIAPVAELAIHPSLQLNAGKPVVSYYQGTALKVSTCTAGCATATPTWVTATVNPNVVGAGQALGLAGGNPVVVHADSNLQEVHLATCAADCQTTSPTWVVSLIVKKQPGDMYFLGQVSLAMDGLTPWVGYERGFIGGSDLTVVACTGGCGTASATWGGASIDVPLQGHSLQVRNGEIAVAYYSFPQLNQDLKYASCTRDCNQSHASWIKSTVDTTGNTGKGASLRFSGAAPVISLYDGAGKLRVARCTAACTSSAPTWSLETIDDGGGDSSSLAMADAVGFASYRDPVNLDLRIGSFPGGPLIRQSATQLFFGLQTMGTSSDPLQSVIENAGGMPVAIGSITGSHPEFTWSHDCPAVLPASQSCRVTATYMPPVEAGEPGASHQDSLILTITDDAPGGPRHVTFFAGHDKSLVPHYYRRILRRAPDQPGYDYWVQEARRVVFNLGGKLDEVWFAMAQSFFNSAEYAAFNRDNAGFVTDLYRTFLDRDPDPAGLAFWVDQRVNGLPREVMLAEFMFSPEFAAFNQRLFPSQFAARAEVSMVMDFFRGLLARLPDDGGLTFWRDRFRAAQCQGQAAIVAEAEAISKAFTDSGEYAARGRSNAQFVGDLYNAFLRRGGELSGVQFWVDQLATGARTRDQVRQAFRDSAEFQARVQAVIQQGCLR